MTRFLKNEKYVIARGATPFEKDEQARDATLFWRRSPGSATIISLIFSGVPQSSPSCAAVCLNHLPHVQLCATVMYVPHVQLYATIMSLKFSCVTCARNFVGMGKQSTWLYGNYFVMDLM